MNGDEYADILATGLHKDPIYDLAPGVIEQQQQTAMGLRENIAFYLMRQYYKKLTGNEFYGEFEKLTAELDKLLDLEAWKRLESEIELAFRSSLPSLPESPWDTYEPIYSYGRGIREPIPYREMEPMLADMHSSFLHDWPQER